jgi:hypothetical protein
MLDPLDKRQHISLYEDFLSFFSPEGCLRIVGSLCHGRLCPVALSKRMACIYRFLEAEFESYGAL